MVAGRFGNDKGGYRLPIFLWLVVIVFDMKNYFIKYAFPAKQATGVSHSLVKRCSIGFLSR